MSNNRKLCIFEATKPLEEKESDEESKVNLEFEKYIEEQKRKLRSLIRF